MYLIHFIGTKSDYIDIALNIRKTFNYNNYLNYSYEIKKHTYDKKWLKLVDAVFIKTSELLKFDEFSKEDMFYDIIESKKVLILDDDYSDSEYLSKLQEELKEFDVMYLINQSFKGIVIDLKNPFPSVVETIKEIFMVQDNQVNKYYTKDYCIRLSVDENNICQQTGIEFNIDSLFRLTDDTMKILNELVNIDTSKIDFDICLYDNIFFYMEYISPEDILDFKYKVFDAIKNLKPEDYPNVSEDIINIINNSFYIPLDDLKEILCIN